MGVRKTADCAQCKLSIMEGASSAPYKYMEYLRKVPTKRGLNDKTCPRCGWDTLSKSIAIVGGVFDVADY